MVELREYLQSLRAGEVDAKTLGQGMHKCFKNACELVEDAELLLERRPGRALSLAVLALEETAKIFLLCHAAGKARDRRLEWREVEESLDIRSHLTKQEIFAAYGKAFLEKVAEEKGEVLYEEDVPAGLAPLLNWFKQAGFYVDFGKGKFHSPTEFGESNREWADWLIGAVKERLEGIRELHSTEERSQRMAVFSGEFVDLLLRLGEEMDEAEISKEVRAFLRNVQRRAT